MVTDLVKAAQKLCFGMCIVPGLFGMTPDLAALKETMASAYGITVEVFDTESTQAGSFLGIAGRAAVISELATELLNRDPNRVGNVCDVAVGHSFGALSLLYALDRETVRVSVRGKQITLPLSQALGVRTLLSVAGALHGTPLAEFILPPNHPAYLDLTEAGSSRFYDPKSPDYLNPRVRIVSISAQISAAEMSKSPALRWGHGEILAMTGLANDGLLTEFSQRLGRHLLTMRDRDHVYFNNLTGTLSPQAFARLWATLYRWARE